MKPHPFLFLPLVLLFAACERTSESGPDPQPENDPVAVAVMTIRPENVRHREPAPGVVRSAGTASVSSRIQGVATEIHAFPGSEVLSGSVLVRLQSDELAARVLRAEAELEAARTELERVRNLRGTLAATQRALDSALARHNVAAAALAEAETFLGYTEIRAPFDGLITRRTIEAGDLVSPADPVFEIVDPDRYRAEVSVSESSAVSLRIGDILAYELDAPSVFGNAPVVEITPASDPHTRTVLVKLDLPPSTELRNGQFVRAFIPGNEQTRIVVPESALVRHGHLEYVFTVHDGRVRLRLVRSGAAGAGKIEILTGLREGEVIVAAPSRQLRDGRAVEHSP